MCVVRLFVFVFVFIHIMTIKSVARKATPSSKRKEALKGAKAPTFKKEKGNKQFNPQLSMKKGSSLRNPKRQYGCYSHKSKKMCSIGWTFWSNMGSSNA